MADPLLLPRETIEKLEVEVTSDVDPTGDAVQFSFVAPGERPDTWTAGEWDGDYSGTKSTAVTPTIGFTGSGATIELAEGAWQAYIKVTDNPEVPVRDCGILVLL